MSFGDRAYRFFTSLRLGSALPAGVEAMNPYREKRVRSYFRAFMRRYFADSRKRVLVFGINPSRFGAGITGIAFTDPVALQEFCGVPNDFPKVRELSSTFVYQAIDAMGGPKKFYRDFFLTAVCPLGFVKSGVNYNFYDHPDLQRDVTPFIVRSIKAHLAFGGRRDVAIVFGSGKLRKYVEDLNATHGFFGRIVALDHPRFIMQYRRRQVPAYVRKYRAAFTEALRGRKRVY